MLRGRRRGRGDDGGRSCVTTGSSARASGASGRQPGSVRHDAEARPNEREEDSIRATSVALITLNKSLLTFTDV